MLLYGLHIFLSLAGVAIFICRRGVSVQSESLLSVHGRDLAVTAPLEMLVGVFSLGHQFGYFNILPMYIMMLVISHRFCSCWLRRVGGPCWLPRSRCTCHGDLRLQPSELAGDRNMVLRSVRVAVHGLRSG